MLYPTVLFTLVSAVLSYLVRFLLKLRGFNRKECCSFRCVSRNCVWYTVL